MLPIRQYKRFVIRAYKCWLKITRPQYSETQRLICEELPLITNVNQIHTTQGFDYSVFDDNNEPSKAVYYALQKDNRFQVVKKNIANDLFEVIAIIVNSKLDCAVMVDEWCVVSDDLHIIEPELPPVFEMVTDEQGRRRLELTSYGFVTNFKAINRCPDRADSEALAQNSRKLYDNF